MTHLLFHDEEEAMDKINIDTLFEKNHKKDLKQLSIFKKILNRIHNRINVTSRSKKDQHIFFTVPEYIFGEPLYDKGECIGYLVVKLEENGFKVEYIHPCTLFVSCKLDGIGRRIVPAFTSGFFDNLFDDLPPARSDPKKLPLTYLVFAPG